MTWTADKLNFLLCDLFGNEYRDLSVMERAMVRDEVRGLSLSAGVDIPLAVQTVGQLAGKSLPAYVASLTVPR